MSKSYIKCPECGTVNLNKEYCTNCGALLNVILKRKIEREKKDEKKVAQEENKKPSRISVFLKKGANHQNALIRSIFQTADMIWTFIAMVIGGIIAAFIAAAAG